MRLTLVSATCIALMFGACSSQGVAEAKAAPTAQAVEAGGAMTTAAAGTPDAFARAVYASYAGEAEYDPKDDGFRVWSHRLQALWDRNEEAQERVQGIVYEGAICMCNDVAVFVVVSTDTVMTGTDRAAVTVRLTDRGRPFTMGLNLAREEGLWRIDDVLFPQDAEFPQPPMAIGLQTAIDEAFAAPAA